MNTPLAIAIATLLTCLPTTATPNTDIRLSLTPQNIATIRITLPPSGANLGFESALPGSHTHLEPLLALIRNATPGGGHKCANAGAIRFLMKDGGVIGVGLLPAHTPGDYGLRVYDGNRHVATYRVDRTALLDALAPFDVPRDDRAFRE